MTLCKGSGVVQVRVRVYKRECVCGGALSILGALALQTARSFVLSKIPGTLTGRFPLYRDVREVLSSHTWLA